MCGINAGGAQGCGCMFTFCHAYLKMGVLLHKMAIVCNQKFMAVSLGPIYKGKYGIVGRYFKGALKSMNRIILLS